MKKIVMVSAMMAASAMASDLESRPEASITTPIENGETFDNVPNFSEKENVDWQKMREERRVAREQILQNLRDKSIAEKKDMIDNSRKKPDENLMKNKNQKFEDEFAHEKKWDEREQEKGPWKKPPMEFVPGHMEFPNPSKPGSAEKKPWEKLNLHDMEKDNSLRK